MTIDDSPTIPTEFPGAEPADRVASALPTEARQPKRRGPGKSKSAGTKSVAIRHHVDVTLTVVGSSQLTRSLLVTASGVAPEHVDVSSVEDVAVAVLEHETQTLKCLQKLRELALLDADESACESVVVQMEDKALFRRIWAVVGILDPDLPKSSPAVQARAGLALSRAIRRLDEDLLNTVTQILDVLN